MIRQKVFAIAFLSTSLFACKPRRDDSQLSENTHVDVSVNTSEYENAGRCAILKHIIATGYSAEKGRADALEARMRVRASEDLWTQVAKERQKRDTGMGFEWVTKLQSRGYIEPMFLADINVPIQFTGTNHWDYYSAMTVATKKARRNLRDA